MATATTRKVKRETLEAALYMSAVRKANMDPNKVYEAPTEGWFTYDYETFDFIPAPDLEIIGRQLIDACDEFEHLAGVGITYLWKKKGPTRNGKVILGTCQKASGLSKYLSDADYIVTLMADHISELQLTRRQVEAVVYHELLHTGEEIDDNGNKHKIIVGHDFEGFSAEILRYGAWRKDLELNRDTWRQLPLFSQAALTQREEGQHGDQALNGDPASNIMYPT